MSKLLLGLIIIGHKLSNWLCLFHEYMLLGRHAAVSQVCHCLTGVQLFDRCAAVDMCFAA